jgi:hypothetical protein
MDFCSPPSLSSSIENIRNSPPSKEEWWTEMACETKMSRTYSGDYEDEAKEEGYETIVLQSPAGQKQFHNCGLETWEKTRAEWNRKTVEMLPPRATPAEYNQLVKGLTKSTSLRTYELPRRMALSDLIDVYNDIWDGERP